MAKDPASQVIFTNKARCRDCYRCVRVCPVKAIRMHEGQAYVVDERCIGCGTCIRECPQKAKSYRNDVDRVVRLIASGVRVAASVAPSFAAAYPDWQRRRLPSALRRLGFSYVGETAIGAYEVAMATAAVVNRQRSQPHVCTACPAVVRYVERYRPEAIDRLVPIVSPMLAHAVHISRELGEGVRVVFIGPCVAKKAEAERPEHAGLVDCVLTFAELDEWMEREAIDLSACEESEFDEVPQGHSRLFALEGGGVRTAGWSTDLLDGELVAVSGFDEVRSILEQVGQPGAPRLVEPLFCPQGCINGPAMTGGQNNFTRRGEVLRYAGERPQGVAPGAAARDAEEKPPTAPLPCESFRAQEMFENGLRTRFSVRKAPKDPPATEQQIRRVLEMTGKAKPEDQLNCGACGYETCREKAVAVIQGLAEPEMCIPYMRRLAEQRTDRIIETSPNGIVILDEHLQILHMNPAFRKHFLCSDAICGQPISRLMDPGPFERLLSGEEELIEMTVEHAPYHLVCHEILYPLREDRQYVGIFVNITHSRTSQQQLDRLRAETVVQARDLLEHQLKMADTIARALGEATARGEDLVEKLVRLAAGENEPGEPRGGQWLQDTYTSK